MSPRSFHSLPSVLFLILLSIPHSLNCLNGNSQGIFKEPREYCKRKSERCRSLMERKFFYLFTCEYCFSHYITLAFLFLTHFKLLYDNWIGYVCSFFALVWVANAYMSLFGRLRVDIRSERANATVKETE